MPTDAPTPSGAMLVWKSNGDDEFFARTPFGTTYVYGENDLGAIIALHAGSYIGTIYPDLDASRAACEADYRERMRAAGWVPAGESERLREALRRLMQEAILDGLEARAGWDCWIMLAREALATAAPPVATVSADAIRAEVAEVIGCFEAAEFEGLHERLAEADDGEPGSLAGLVRRRLMFAYYAAARLSALLPKPAQEEQS